MLGAQQAMSQKGGPAGQLGTPTINRMEQIIVRGIAPTRRGDYLDCIKMLRSRLALLMILLATPAYAGSRFGGGFDGGGFPGGSGFHGSRVSAFHRSGGRARRFFGGFFGGYGCGYGFDCGVYDYGYGYGGYGYGYGGGGGAGNAVGSGGGSIGGYVPDPVGAEIPPMIFPTNCWVRRAAHDPSGAHVGQVLIDLCHPSDSVTVTGLKAQAKAPDAGTGAGQPAPLYRSGAPKSPP
jgi:hypothetical protein